MRIQFQSDGGFGFFPGLARPLDLDSARLPDDRAAELERLVQGAGFFSLPAKVGAAAPGSADVRTYTITIEANGRPHTVQAVEPVENPQLQRLVEFLLAEQRR